MAAAERQGSRTAWMRCFGLKRIAGRRFPFLAPVPKRGKLNEPAYVRHTAEFIAQLRGDSLENIAAATTDNFFKLFDKIPRPQ